IPFDLESLSNDVAEIMAIKCGEKNVEMLMRYAPGTPRFVVGDPGRVRQILINLISNAIKFTHEGHVLLYIQSQQTIDNTILFRVEIQDTGIGIPDDKLDLIFNKFDQADQSTTRQYGGTGLGLAICKRLAEMMNGDIGVYSKIDKGSTFWFTMELEKNLTQPKPKLDKKEISLENVKVLAIDRSDTALDILTEQLKSKGIQITTTHTARAALEAMNNKSFDIIITEQNISSMNGEELAQKVTKKFRGNVPLLIMLTSTPFKGDGAHLKEIGFNGYITKPTSPDDMYQIISTAYDAHINGLDKGLITRHTIREDKCQNREAIKLNHAELLLAEDNVINQMVATTMLESIDGVVNIAGNGREAVNLATQRPYDIIFMDCHMPEMDGYEATQNIRKYEQKHALTRTPIIALTANAMSGDREKCLHAGMDDYISKPTRQDTLEKVLQKWIPEKIKYDYRIIHHEKESNDKNETKEKIVDFTVLNRLQEISGEIIFKLISEADHLIQDAQESIEKQDSIQLAEAAHALKSFSKLVGANQLEHISLEIEMCGHAQKTGEALIMLDQLMARYNEVITTLKDYIESHKEDSDSSSTKSS
ncbi:MAG: response regulator, partial [Rickettsiales bacterium]|nr:response regulator [Rickettsiales bacterium]